MDAESGADVEETFAQDTLGALEDIEAEQAFYDLWRLARLDGGCAIVLVTNDGAPPHLPLNPKNLRSIDKLNIVTRFELTPGELDLDPGSTNFRNPETWTFSDPHGRQGGVIHHTRIIPMQGFKISPSYDREGAVLGLSEPYWGVPIIYSLHDKLRQFHTTFDYTEAVFADIAQGVFKIKDLAELMKSPESREKLMKRMQLTAMAKSAFNMLLLDADNEDFEKRTTAFAGVDTTLVRFMELLSAVSEIPMTKLFGIAPGGLTSDDQSAEKTFNAMIAQKQKRLLRKPLNRLLYLLFASKNGPTNGEAPESWRLVFEPLDEPDGNQLAEKRRMEAETDRLHLENGSVSVMEVRGRLRGEADHGYPLDSDFDDALQELEKEDPLLGQDPLQAVDPFGDEGDEYDESGQPKPPEVRDPEGSTGERASDPTDSPPKR